MGNGGSWRQELVLIWDSAARMSLFEPLTFVNKDEDNYQQASDSDGEIDGEFSSLHGGSHKAKSKKNGSNSDKSSENENETENESSKTSVLTRTKSVSHHIRWEIDDRSIQIAKLATKADKRGVIEATVIKDGYDFKLELCASGWRSSQDGYCAFYLTVPNMTDTFVARYRVQFGTTSRVSSIRHDFQLGVGFPNFCHQDTLDSCLTNKVCVFNIVIEIFNCESTIKLPLAPLCGTQPDSVLAQLMRSMYHNRLHSDVKLICHGKIIKAHKVVLSHASPVFKAMFTHNLYENNMNEVSMLEWDQCIVEAFIKYLYTATIDIKTDSRHSKKYHRYSNSNSGIIGSNHLISKKQLSSFYTASTKSSMFQSKHGKRQGKPLKSQFLSISNLDSINAINNINNNSINNNNTNINENSNDSNNTSLLGLDEIDIDESKTFAYNEMFEKKENSHSQSRSQSNSNLNSQSEMESEQITSELSEDNSGNSANSDHSDNSSDESDDSSDNSDDSDQLFDTNNDNNNNNNVVKEESVNNEKTNLDTNNSSKSGSNTEGEIFENTSSERDVGETDEIAIESTVKKNKKSKNDTDKEQSVPQITQIRKKQTKRTNQTTQTRMSTQTAQTQTSQPNASINENMNGNSNSSSSGIVSIESTIHTTQSNSSHNSSNNATFNNLEMSSIFNDIAMKSETSNNNNSINLRHSNSSSNSLITTPERRVAKNNDNGIYLQPPIGMNDEKDDISNTVIDAASNTVSIVDMSEQGVGSPCATRLRRVRKRDKHDKHSAHSEHSSRRPKRSKQSQHRRETHDSSEERSNTNNNDSGNISSININNNNNNDDANGKNSSNIVVSVNEDEPRLEIEIDTNNNNNNNNNSNDVASPPRIPILFAINKDKNGNNGTNDKSGNKNDNNNDKKSMNSVNGSLNSNSNSTLEKNNKVKKLKLKLKQKQKEKQREKKGASQQSREKNENEKKLLKKEKKDNKRKKQRKDRKDGKHGKDGKDHKYSKRNKRNQNKKNRKQRDSDKKHKKYAKSKKNINERNGSTDIMNDNRLLLPNARHNALSKNATFKLFEIAEFYKVTNLVIACCQKMHREIKVKTACDLLIRIHRYEHVKELKQIQESVWLFVSNNIRPVMHTQGYKFILTHYPHLLGQLIEKITN